MSERERHLRGQRILADLGDCALGAASLDEILAEACRLVAEAFGARRTGIMEALPNERALLLRAGTGWASDAAGRLRVPMDEPTETSIAAGEPVAGPDGLDVPILLPGRVAYGLLRLVSAAEPPDFSDDDARILRLVATTLGPVIDRFREIERRRAAEAREERNEARFRAIFDTAAVGLSVIGPDGRFLRVNAALASMLGRPPEALLALGLADVTEAGDVAASLAALRRSLETGETVSLDQRYRRPDGRLVPAGSSLSPLPAGEGEARFLAVTVDLTARHCAEQALREREAEHRRELEARVDRATAELKTSRDFLQAALDASTDMIQIFEAVRDEAGEIVDFRWLLNNQTSETLFGEIHGETLLARNPGVVEEGIFDAFRRVAETGVPEQAERHYVHEQFDGWFYQSVVRLNDGVATTTKDIGAWKAAQAEILRLHEERAAARLRESEELHRLILEGARDYAIFTTDEAGRVTSWSPGAQAVFGWSEAEMIGQDVSITFTPEDRAANAPRRARETAARDGVAADVHWRLRKGGQRIVLEGSMRPLPETAEGGRRGFIKIGQDITSRREAEERQAVLVAELQHRTRNLLGVVRSIADRTAAGATTLEGFLARYRERLSALSRINSLLSKLGTGERVTFDEIIGTELRARGFLDRDEAPDARIALEGPRGVRLRSASVQTLALAIHELATNSVKYGALSEDEGRLRVLWQISEDEAGLARLRVDWIETGVPDMPEEGAAPQGGGYGRMLIEQALPYQLRARTAYELTPDGVRCMIDLPIV